MTNLMRAQSLKPLALCVDDDPDFIRILHFILKRLGMDVLAVGTAEEFLKAIKSRRPDLCLVDLHLDGLDAGFILIQAVRKVVGPDLPLVVVSGHMDRQSIAHALEIGANDYFVKPVDEELIATKLQRYIDSDEMKQAAEPMKKVPEEVSRAYASLPVEITEIDELGMGLLSPHLVSKGTALYLDHAFIHQVTGKAHPVLATVTNTWLDSDGIHFGAYAEFDDADEDLRASVRRWIVANMRAGTSEK